MPINYKVGEICDSAQQATFDKKGTFLQILHKKGGGISKDTTALCDLSLALPRLLPLKPGSPGLYGLISQKSR